MPEEDQVQIEKERLRHIMRAKRRAMSEEQVSRLSESICTQIEALSDFQSARCICLYIPFDNEVDTLPLIQRTLGHKRVLATRVLSNNTLELRELISLDRLQKGGFGVLEPDDTCPLAELHQVDIFLVPGIAFDTHGNRVGFGAGHFDRLLAESKAQLVGVAYRFQIVPELPSEAHDIKMHRIICDNPNI